MQRFDSKLLVALLLSAAPGVLAAPPPGLPAPTREGSEQLEVDPLAENRLVVFLESVAVNTPHPCEVVSERRRIEVQARKGDVAAQRDLATFHARHSRTEAAHTWLVRAAEGGDARAQNILSAWYWFGVEPPAQDTEESIRWARLAAEKGDASALEFLTILGLYLIGAASDDTESIHVLEKWHVETRGEGEQEAPEAAKAESRTLTLELTCNGSPRGGDLAGDVAISIWVGEVAVIQQRGSIRKVTADSGWTRKVYRGVIRIPQVPSNATALTLEVRDRTHRKGSRPGCIQFTFSTEIPRRIKHVWYSDLLSRSLSRNVGQCHGRHCDHGGSVKEDCPP